MKISNQGLIKARMGRMAKYCGSIYLIYKEAELSEREEEGGSQYFVKN